MALDWFRRYRKTFLAVLTAFLMIVFLPGMVTGMQWLVQLCLGGRAGAGTIFGRNVSDAELTAFAQRWEAAFMQGERENKQIRQGLWRRLAMVKEARRAGLEVSPEEVQNYIKMSLGRGRPINDLSYEAFLRTRRMTRDDYEQTVGELLLCMKLMGMVGDQATLSTTELWQRYAHDNEKLKVRYVALRPEYFIPQIHVTPEQVKTFYDEHKNDIADPAAGVPGYKLKEAVKADVLLANYADVQKLVKISDDDVKKYYDEHKDSFKIEPKEEPKKEEAKKAEPKKDEPKATEPKKEEPKKGAAKTEAPKDQKAAEAKPGAEKPKAAEPPKTPPPPQYKPFAEVKEEIRQKLAAKEARRTAKDLIARADEVVGDQLKDPGRADFPKIAKDLEKDGLKLRQCDFFTKDDETIVPEIPGFATEAFSRTEWEPSPRTEGQEGWYIFQVTTRRPSEVQPLSAVHDQVVKDLTADLAMKKAIELAQRCEKTAAASGLEAVLAAAQKDLPKLPEKPAPPAPAKEKGKEKAPPEKAKAADVLKIQESDFFTRPGPAGENQMRGPGDERPNMAREAFQLQDKAVGLAIEETGDKAAYLIRVAERKPADPAEFKKNIALYRMRYVGEEQAAVQRAWMDNLTKNIHLDERKWQGKPVPVQEED